MPAQGDSRILDLLDEALGRGPLDVLQILGALRSRAAKLLGRHEGRVHPLLQGLLLRGHLHVAEMGANGLGRYALGTGPKGEAAREPAAPPASANEALRPGALRSARRIASGVRSAADRTRIEADVQAHLAALEKKQRMAAFGSARNVRHLLHRVDRKREVVLFPAGTLDHVRKFVVEEGPWILTAILAFLLIHAFLAEVFFIPSSSMVPTLLEDDRVVVFKPGARGEMPERWSIVTFDRQGTTFVKRVIGLGGETVLLQGGDPYINGELLVRPKDLREDLRAPYRTWELGKPSPDWRPHVEKDERSLEYAGPALLSGGHDEDGNPRYPGDVRLRDVYAELEGERDAGGKLILELVYASPRDTTVSTWIALRVDDEGADVVIVTQDGRRELVRVSETAPTGRSVVQLAYVDGEITARIPGAGETSFLLDEGLRPRRGDVVRPWLRAVGRASIQRFHLDKDHHYTLVGHRAVADPRSDEDPQTYAHPVPEGTVFLLGDNSYSSNDGRFRQVGDIPVDKLIGPVVFRIWPPLRVGPVR